MWYIPPIQPHPPRWLLYTRSFILEMLQGCRWSPENVRHTLAWDALAALLIVCVAVAQPVLMLLSRIPVLSWLMYMLARAFPRNAAGFFLRGCYWKARLAHLGADTLIDQGVEFNAPGRIRVGTRCHIDRNVLLSVGSEPGYIHIGDHVFIGPSSHIAGRGGVEIGAFCGLSARVHIYSVTNLPYHADRPGELATMSHAAPLARQCTITQPVIIGDHVVIGPGAILLPGAALGRGAVVHAYSEVSSVFPKFAIVSGHGRGVQKGWRRPGGLDARLQPGSSAVQPGGPSGADRADDPAVAEVDSCAKVS